ncbi:MAG: glycosyltransferase [Sedimentisphaerales bacterium]|nr:glycosyltransferase [Sedimentisphaerales bacterium]
MKIAFILKIFPSISETFTLNQITGLIDKGHDVRIFAVKRGDMEVMHPEVEKYHLFEKTVFLPKEIKNKWLCRLKQLLLFPGICIRNPRLLNYCKSLNSMKIFLWPLECTLARYYDKYGTFDITHAQFGDVAVDPNLVRLKKTGVLSGPLVVFFRGHDAYIYLRTWPKYYDDLFQNADKFLTVSEAIKQLLLEHGAPEDKVSVHHSGICLDEFPFSTRELPLTGPVRLLCAARFVEYKGINYLLDAVSRLHRSGFNIQLDVIGDGPLKHNYQEQIESLGIDRIVQLHGSLIRSNVLQFLQKAHILIHPSIRAANNEEEGIPNILKEAMASGLPVIATKTGGIPEIVEDGVTGFLVPQKDVEALVEKIIYLIEHPQIWAGIARAGRARIESEYDSDKLNEQLIELYRQLLKKIITKNN